MDAGRGRDRRLREVKRGQKKSDFLVANSILRCGPVFYEESIVIRRFPNCGLAVARINIVAFSGNTNIQDVGRASFPHPAPTQRVAR